MVRLIIAIVMLFFIFVACTEIRNSFSNKERKSLIAFEDFVSGINVMERTNREFTLILEKKSAIIGFSSNSEDWVCTKCKDGPTNKFIKPSAVECSGKACVCLCTDLKFADDKKNLLCGNLRCKSIEKEIEQTTEFLDDGAYWLEGFLFAIDMDDVNGLSKIKDTTIALYVDIKDDKIAVCNNEMRLYNIATKGQDVCIIRE